jgi:glutamate-1-semialdehyde 2,1-aminomutase
LTEGLAAAAKKHGVVFSAQAIGGMFGIYFRANVPRSFAEVMECDKDAFNRFFHAMLERGVHFAPSAYEAGFVSAAHSEQDIGTTISAAEAVFAVLGK